MPWCAYATATCSASRASSSRTTPMICSSQTRAKRDLRDIKTIVFVPRVPRPACGERVALSEAKGRVRGSAYSRHELAKLRQLPQRIESRIDTDEHHPRRSIVECNPQRPHRLGLIAEAGVNHRQVVRRHVARLRLLTQRVERFDRFHTLACDRVRVADHREQDRRPLDIERAMERVDRFAETLLLSEGHAEPAVRGDEFLVELE